MIELVPAEYDDVAFLLLAQRIMNGAIAELRMREVFLVHVDNWFDHKWLGWWSRKDDELRVPTFTPNRVHSEKHFLWKAETAVWEGVELQRPLHIRQPGRPFLVGAEKIANGVECKSDRETDAGTNGLTMGKIRRNL